MRAKPFSMGVPAYTIVVVCMGALSAAAAVGALALALGQLAPRKPVRRRPTRAPMMFDPPPAAPPRPQPTSEPFRLAPTPAAPTPPIPTGRLDLALMSRRAPERLRVPIDLARGRILELNLPLLIANAGDADLENVSVHVTLPNEITYGASLERLARNGMPGLPEATVRYALSEAETHIRVDIPRLAAGAIATLPAPISIKHAADVAYPILASAFAQGLEPLQRRYELELMGPAMTAPVSSKEAWVCRPDETSRQRDPHLPLDRIGSMQFSIFESGASALA
ncbi:MAG TPA: hypothetical protein VIJ94_10020 [Caulobacteraceae bacterium]